MYTASKTLKSKMIGHNTDIDFYMLCFWVENCSKFEDENVPEKFFGRNGAL
jgi:hypothetical protein